MFRHALSAVWGPERVVCAVVVVVLVLVLADEAPRALGVELTRFLMRPRCWNAGVAVVVADVMRLRCTVLVR